MKILISISWLCLLASSVAFNESASEEEERLDSYGVNMDRIGFFKVPSYLLRQYSRLKTIHLSANKIRHIGKDDFPAEAVQELRYINLHNNYISSIHEDAFANMPNLLIVDLSNNLLNELPVLKAPNLTKIFFRRNQIRKISSKAMRQFKSLEHLEIQGNKIEQIDAKTFRENKKLVYLDLSDNPLNRIDEKGLVGPTSLKYLYLKNTLLSHFPSEGISKLERINIQNVPNLFTIPKVSLFKKLEEITVTYSMHCCPFRTKIKEHEQISSNGTVPCNRTLSTEEHLDEEHESNFLTTTEASLTVNDTSNTFGNIFGDNFGKEFMEGMLDMIYGNVDDLCDADEEEIRYILEKLPVYHIQCKPEPDAFNPCQDVMGTDVLRAFSWIIATFSIIGNLFQLVILFHSKQKSVYKLLMYNLGISNLFMGVYLLVLCCVDAYTFGEYYNFVRTWQYNGGCQAFGFLAVFATSLSVCSLILITVERFLLIIFALQSGNQMKYRHAKYCVAASWFYSFVVAIFPATNVISSYSKTAICLPMDVYTKVSESYVVWLLIAYIIAFLMISYCYVRMYRNIKDVRPVSTNNAIDTKVAKRMALIIFSNFLCWLPISFAGLFAMYSGLVFNVNVAKFLIVFIFPLNACTNPFLYAIFTKVFRDDTISLLNTIGLCREKSPGNDETRHRNSSIFKNKKNRADTNTRTYMHVQAPSEGCLFGSSRHIEAETDFGSPQTPLRLMVETNDDRKNINSTPEYYSNNERKLRSGSTRGLLDDYKRGRGDKLPCSESTETASTGMSFRSTIENDDNFSNLVGSVQNAEQSVLCT